MNYDWVDSNKTWKTIDLHRLDEKMKPSVSLNMYTGRSMPMNSIVHTCKTLGQTKCTHSMLS